MAEKCIQINEIVNATSTSVNQTDVVDTKAIAQDSQQHTTIAGSNTECPKSSKDLPTTNAKISTTDQKLKGSEDDVNDDECIEASDSEIISTNSSIIQSTVGGEYQLDGDKVEVYLETPVLEENNIDTDNPNTFPVVDLQNAAKPKRLSDEFFSADDGDEEEEVGGCKVDEPSSGHSNVAMDTDTDFAVASSSQCTLTTDYVQSLNAIERMDFAEEQRLTNAGGRSFCDGISTNALNTNSTKNINRLNLDLISHVVVDDADGNDVDDENADGACRHNEPEVMCRSPICGSADKSDQLTATPTSTRRNRSPESSGVAIRSSAKLNLSANLESMIKQETADPRSNDSSCQQQQVFDSTIKTGNDNVQLINERDQDSYDSNKETKADDLSEHLSNEPASPKSSDHCPVNSMLPSTSGASDPTSLFSNCKFLKKRLVDDDVDGEDNDFDEMEDLENEPICDDDKLRMLTTHSESKPSSSTSSGNSQPTHPRSNNGSSELPLSTSSSGRSSRQDPINQNVEDDHIELNPISLPAAAIIAIEHQQDHEMDEDMWADCEEGSEAEEVCTCRNYADDEMSSEDELPSRDVDLSGYTHDDILQESSTTTPRNYRKRRVTDTRIMYSGDGALVSESYGKRLALDSSLGYTSPRSVGVSKSLILSVISPSINTTPTSAQSLERRTPRLLIPTKDNPPPELNEWLIQFQRWSNAERLLAVDRLIETCEPTQVRHMMKVIEPQFQRDFISLLPKELALQVLSYLQPKDLLRAAQTCRSWRFLADDNLLWKEKCKQAAIVMEPSSDRPKRGRAGNMPPISSAWKAAYIRQHTIEMNWRTRPIRSPKVLKGHDDHVITCLQFCGNRIVSGSDDNTLKVWSAITGKCLRTLVGHTGGVWSSQMAGTIIISGSTDRTLKVWNADSGQCLHTLYGHTSTVRCMHLHGNKVVSGSRDATLRVWDINEGTCLHVLVGHLAAVRCVQYDGRLVVSGAYDYMVKVWNPERQECLHTLQGHTNRVYSLQFDGIHVVSGSLDTSIRVWDAETGSCKHTLMGHQSLTSGMELRSNILVSGNADSTVKVWDIINGQCLQTLSGPNKHQSAVTCLQFNSRFVITSSDDGTVKLWDVKTGDFIRNLVSLDSGGSGGVVWRIRANDTKLICAVGSRNGTEETKLMVLDFDVEGACLKCS